MLSSGMLLRVALLRTDLCSVLRFLITANDVPSSPILVTLMMGRYVPPKRRFLQQPHNIPEDRILYSHSPENVKVYILLGAGLCSREVMCFL
jgi:hypothetical protein